MKLYVTCEIVNSLRLLSQCLIITVFCMVTVFFVSELTSQAIYIPLVLQNKKENNNYIIIMLGPQNSQGIMFLQKKLPLLLCTNRYFVIRTI